MAVAVVYTARMKKIFPRTGARGLRFPRAAADGHADIYGVVGWPLAQSLSPLLHNTGFAALGLPAIYRRFEIPPQSLAAFMDSVRLLGIKGCSVTIPHKVPLLPFLDETSPAVCRVGAANTVFWREGRLCGENTDVAGFLAPLADTRFAGGDALLLGAGGAARAAAAGLLSLPADRRPTQIFVTTPSDASHLPLAEEFDLHPLPWRERHSMQARLIVNATPLGMRGKAQDASPYDFSSRAPRAIAYDMVYNPLETRFLREARSAGLTCISGLEMFFAQGDAQFRLWTGRPLPPTARRALHAALAGTAP